MHECGGSETGVQGQMCMNKNSEGLIKVLYLAVGNVIST